MAFEVDGINHEYSKKESLEKFEKFINETSLVLNNE
jgi:hypothetical protein